MFEKKDRGINESNDLVVLVVAEFLHRYRGPISCAKYTRKQDSHSLESLEETITISKLIKYLHNIIVLHILSYM